MATYNPLLGKGAAGMLSRDIKEAFELSGAAVEGEEYFKRELAKGNAAGMKKVLRWPELISLGIGATIGAGIFVVTGAVARDTAGPALCLSYIFSGFCCLLSSFSYAEFAAISPQAGSAYGFTKATMGTWWGWVIGWDLILEYGVTAAGVSQGWSKYFNALLKLFGAEVPLLIRSAPWAYDPDTGKITVTGSMFDVPAVLISFTLTLILIRGIKESARINNFMVAFKVTIVLFVILGGIAFISPSNYQPFMPYGFFGISFFGYTAVGGTDKKGDSVGVLAAASIVFFAFIGFDAVSTQAEECENPQRDLPIGIVGSLVVSTVLYVSVALVLVGMVPYQQIDREAPLSSAFGDHGMKWAQVIVSLGALAGLSSVMLVNLLGQPRILMAMARDGLLPKEFFSDIHPTFRTPYRSTALTGLFVAIVGALIPLSVLVELVSMGTLMAFGFVNVSVIILRRTQPNLHRPFKCPYCPWVPGAGAASCFLLMLSLPSTNWVRLIVWFLIGMTVYKFYSVPNMARIAAEASAKEKDDTATVRAARHPEYARDGWIEKHAVETEEVLSPLH